MSINNAPEELAAMKSMIHREDLIEMVDCIEAGKIIEAYTISASILDTKPDDAIQIFAFKEICNYHGMWALVDQAWTGALAKWIGNRKVLEVMAGAGWLARALHDHGVNIHATDNHSRHADTDMHLFPVEQQDAVEAARSSEADILLVTWPDHGDQTLVEVCQAWGSDRPILYLGELGGCTGCPEFFQGVELRGMGIDTPRFFGIKDGLFVGNWKG